MKAGWKVKPLADLCEIFADGDWIESKDQSADGIRLIQTGNVGEGLFKDRAEKARYISEATFKQLRCTEIFEGDCLISRLPDPVGRACILPDTGERMITAVDCTIIRFGNDTLTPQFFAYYSQSGDYLADVDAETTGTTRTRISRSSLGRIPIPVPSILEQHRIVAILDEALDGIATAKANAEKNMLNARDLFDAQLRKFFAGESGAGTMHTLREVSIDFGRGKSKHRPRNDPKLYGGKYPFVQTGDIRNANQTVTEYSQTYNDIGLAQSKLWPKGALCITIAANIAETAILGFAACFPDSIIGVVVDEKLANHKYLEYLLQTAKAELKAKGKGSAQDNLNLAAFENHRFPFPSIEAQRKLVQSLDALAAETRRLESLYQQKLAALAELKKSLLHEAFAGKL